MIDQTRTVDDESLLGMVAGEFYDQMARGQQPDPAEYAQRYPQIAEHILRIFPAMGAIGDSLAEGLPASSSIDPSKQKQLGDFRIAREIGRGGMGVVYAAEQLSMGRRVALKVLPFAALADDKALMRFHNEVRAAATLQHPNIVPVFGVGEDRGIHYYAMQLIKGQTLAEVIAVLRQMRAKSKSLDGSSISQALSSATPAADLANTPTTGRGQVDRSSEAAETQAAVSLTTIATSADREFYRSVAALGVQAARALQHAHEQGVVHRDVKPGNLMLDTSGNMWVTDFGLARIESDPGVTMTGDLVGTLRYMSPEQAVGNRIMVDNRVDVYSLSATLYELISLRPVFTGEDRRKLLKQITLEESVPLRRLDRHVPRELQTIIQKGLAKDPDQRYLSAAELGDDLKRFLDYEPIAARPPSLFERTRKWTQRHKAIVNTAAGTLAVAIIISGGLLWHARTATLAAFTAEKQQRRAAEQNETEAKNQAAAAQRARAAEAVARQEAERQGKLARENFEQARAAVDEYLTRVSEETLLDTPGLQPLRKDLLKLALNYYRQFTAQRGDDPDLQADLAAAYSRVGKITALIGSQEAALQAYRKEVDILKTLVVENPTVVEYRAHLATAYFQVSMRLKETGDTDEALTFVRKAFSVQNELVRENPGVSDYRVSLAKTYYGLGQLQRATRANDEALTSHQKGLAIQQKLVTENPGVSKYQASLAGHYNETGLLKGDSGRLNEAMTFRRKAIQILQELVAANPDVSDYQFCLAGSHSNLGRCQKDIGKQDDAITSYQKAIEISKTVAAHNPAVPKYRAFLAIHYLNLGVLQSVKGKQDAALASNQEATEILAKLAQENPGVVEYQGILAGSYNNRGLMQWETGDIDAALVSYQAAIKIKQELAKESPDVVEYKSTLAGSYRNLGLLQQDTGSMDAALASYQKALATRKRLADENPMVTNYQYNLATLYDSLGYLQMDLGRTDESRANFQNALRILDKLVTEHPDVPDYRQVLAESSSLLGQLKRDVGDTDAAYDLLEKAVTMLEVLAAENPGRTAYPSDWACACTELGSLQRDTGKMAEAVSSFATATDLLQEIVKNGDFNLRHQHRLARAYLKQGDLQRVTEKPDEATAAYERAVGLWIEIPEQSRTVDHWSDLGEALYRLGRWSESRDALQEVIKMRSEDAPTLAGGPRWWFLTMALSQMGQKQQAREFYTQLAQFPESSTNMKYALLRAEAANLLGIEESDKAKPKAQD